MLQTQLERQVSADFWGLGLFANTCVYRTGSGELLNICKWGNSKSKLCLGYPRSRATGQSEETKNQKEDSVWRETRGAVLRFCSEEAGKGCRRRF